MSRYTVITKISVAAVLAVALWGGSGALGFPHVFRVMFAGYVALGLLVFLLLDAPPLARVSGRAAVVALAGFYVGLSALYIAGASVLPQYDPGVEKGKIEKILKRTRERALAARSGTDALLQQVKTLEARSAAVAARLAGFDPAAAVRHESLTPPAGGVTTVERGAEVYELYECYNCHKIGGKGSVKKRGPVLDNIGSFLTVSDIKKKILDPGYLYAEGFEKEHKKGRMPDTYKDLMMEEEVQSLAMYLFTLKNPSVATPRPVFVRTKVDHGFTVFGYVRDAAGRGVAGVEVQARPKVRGGHASSGTTNDSGYYEIVLHMHNENAGATVVVSAQGVTKEFVAAYDPGDHVTRRRQSVNVTVAGAPG